MEQDRSREQEHASGVTSASSDTPSDPQLPDDAPSIPGSQVLLTTPVWCRKGASPDIYHVETGTPNLILDTLPLLRVYPVTPARRRRA